MSSFRQYSHEIFYLLGEDRNKLFLLVVLFLLSALLDVAGIGLIAPYVSLVVNPDSLNDESFRDVLVILSIPLDQKKILIVLSVGIFLIFLFKAIAAIYITKRIIRFSQQQPIRLRALLMNAYQNMRYEDYLLKNSADYIHTTQTLVGQYANRIVLVGLKAFSDGIVSLIILVMLAWANSLALAILVLLFGGFVFGYDWIFRRKIIRYGEKTNEALTSMVQGVHEGIEGLKEIRILGKEQFFFNVVHDGSLKAAYYQTRSQVVSTVPRYLLEFLMIAFVILLVLGTLLLDMQLEALVPMLAMFGVAAIRLLPSVNSISNCLVQFRNSRHSVSRLYDDVSAIQEQSRIGNHALSYVEDQAIFQRFELNNVRFRYPESDNFSLDGVSIEVKHGESIGFIGASGSGKTTLLDVLLGLLSPQQGEVLYNGRPLAQKMSVWRQQVAYIPQEIFLTDQSLADNVALGVSEQDIDSVILNESLRQARLTELVDDLPNGTDTVIGERGVRLSGGQRQRIALARAFYHGRNILIMDEATSALDNETEKEIVEEIRRLKGRKTLLVIAHRLSTLRDCDKIYVLEKGKIVNVGPPEKILKR